MIFQTCHLVDRLTYAMACKLTQVSLNVPGELLVLQVQYIQEGVNPSTALTASTDPDSMYYHQAMRKHDWDTFLKGMQEELDNQINARNFAIHKQNEIS